MRTGLVCLAATGLFLGGCVIETTPPPESVLAGTWQLTTPTSSTLTQTYLTFDTNGNLSKIVYKIGTSATVTDNSPWGVADVNGKSVTINSQFAGNGLILNGTLNDTNTVIQGTNGTEIRVGSLTITVDNGPVTLTKQ